MTPKPRTRPNTCFGCIHLTYRGPEGLLPPHEIDEDAGEYQCRKLLEILARGRNTPRPLTDNCKEQL